MRYNVTRINPLSMENTSANGSKDRDARRKGLIFPHGKQGSQLQVMVSCLILLRAAFLFLQKGWRGWITALAVRAVF